MLQKIQIIYKVLPLQVNKMVLEEHVPDEPLRFVLRSNDPTQSSVLKLINQFLNSNKSIKIIKKTKIKF